MLNLIYTGVRIFHNFGAIAVVGSPVAGWWLARTRMDDHNKLAWLVMLGWTVQGASGAGFGLTSYFAKGQLPELAGEALAALLIKVGCALVGCGLAVAYLRTGFRWSPLRRLRMWQGMLILAGTALSAAAVLRWFI